jgi:hypothetical protein
MLRVMDASGKEAADASAKEAADASTKEAGDASAKEAAPPAGGRVRSRHRVVIPILLTLGVIIGFFACFAVWVNRQVLNTNNWTNTTGELLAHEKVQVAVSTYAVNQLFDSVNVAEQLKSGLPTQLQGLSGPAAAGLHALAERAVPRLLATAQVQEGWRRANRAAHAEFISILNGGSKTVSTKSGVVSLNLEELITQLAAQLGLQSQLKAAREHLQGASGAKARAVAKEKLGVALPPAGGQLVILRSHQLKTAQEIVKGVKGLAIVLPLVALALFALAVWLDAGRRRRALRNVGWCFFGIGVFLLLARRVAGDSLVNSLVKVPANKPAADEVWTIATSLLYQIAVAMVLYGLVLVAAAWLAGTTRPAVAVRRAWAPWLREHALGSYVVAGAILLLIVLWGPTPATRQVIPVIGFAVLAALGVRILRAMTAREFPDAQPGETAERLRHWLASVRARRGAPAPGAAGAAGVAGAAATDSNGSRLETLERLAALHERGALSDEEFAEEKRQLAAAAPST